MAKKGRTFEEEKETSTPKKPARDEVAKKAMAHPSLKDELQEMTFNDSSVKKKKPAA